MLMSSATPWPKCLQRTFGLRPTRAFIRVDDDRLDDPDHLAGHWIDPLAW
jgi:hypothetical protein